MSGNCIHNSCDVCWKTCWIDIIQLRFKVVKLTSTQGLIWLFIPSQGQHQLTLAITHHSVCLVSVLSNRFHVQYFQNEQSFTCALQNSCTLIPWGKLAKAHAETWRVSLPRTTLSCHCLTPQKRAWLHREHAVLVAFNHTSAIQKHLWNCLWMRTCKLNIKIILLTFLTDLFMCFLGGSADCVQKNSMRWDC